MNSLPKELYINILSFLDSEEDVLSLLEAFPLELTEHDWANLLSLRYSDYFRKGIYAHKNIKDIYLQFLKLPNLTDITSSESVLRPLKYINALRYLMMEKLIYTDIDTIAQFDDIDLLYLSDAIRKDSEGCVYDLMKLSNYLKYFLDQDSVNIIEYIFENKLYNDDTVRDIIVGIYRGRDISLKTTELIFKYVTFKEDDIITILLYMLPGYIYSYNYIFNMLPDEPNNDTWWSVLVEFSSSDDFVPNPKNFIHIWNKYNHLLDSQVMCKIYANFFGMVREASSSSEEDEWITVITLIAQHPVIRERYLKY